MNTTTTPSMLEAAITAADYGAKQSDRWMFVAMLIIFMIAGVWMTKYFTDQVREARKEYKDLSEGFTSHLKTANTEMTVALKENASVAEKTNQLLVTVENTLKDILNKK